MVQKSLFQRIIVLAVLGLMVFAVPALAQDDPESGLGDEEGTGDEEEEDATDSATGQWGGSAQAQPKSDYYNQSSSSDMDTSSSSSGSSGSDHDKVVGTVGIGYFGVLSLPIGTTEIDPTDPVASIGSGETVPAPTVGIRFWLSDFLGVEAALGIGISDNSFDNGVSEVAMSAVGFALHGGLPLALAHDGHFVFEIVPELNLGISSGSLIPDMDNEDLDVDLSGFMFELGARAGAEVHFGFIDIPHLALQATVGIRLRHESGSTDSQGGEQSSSSTYFGTTVDGEPWDIFTGSIAAIYYIPLSSLLKLFDKYLLNAESLWEIRRSSFKPCHIPILTSYIK